MIESKILTCLSPEYDTFITAWDSTAKNEKNLKNLKLRLIKEYEKHAEKNEEIAFRVSQVTASSSRNKVNKMRCFNCNKPGHLKKDCKNVCSICKKNNHTEKNCFFRNKNSQTGHVALYGLDSSVVDKGNIVEFVVDSGCTSHMVSNKKMLNDIVNNNTQIGLANKNCKMIAEYSGNFVGKNCTLNNTLCVPDLSENLLSVSAATNKGGKVIFEKDRVEIVGATGNKIKGIKEDTGLYKIKVIKDSDGMSLLAKKETHYNWHTKMGHCGDDALIKLIKIADGISLSEKEIKNCVEKCDICIKAKQTRKPFATVREKAVRKLEIIHSDVCGPIECETWDGMRYILTILDDYTHYTKIYLIKNKNQVNGYLKHYINEVERETDYKVSKLRCDNGGEYTGKDFKEWCYKKGIIIDYTVPYCPQLNGKAERLNRTIMEKTRSLIYDSKLQKEMWGEAVYTAAYLINRLPTAGLDITPYEAWTNRKPNLSNIQKFGCEAYVKTLKPIKKLEPRADKYIMVGYYRTGYRLFDEIKRKVILARDVIFLNNSIKTEAIKENNSQGYDIFFNEESQEEDQNTDEFLSPAESGCSSDESEKEDTNKNIEIKTVVKEPENVKQENVIIREGRSKREIKLPERYSDYVLLTFQEAMQSPEKEKWKEAIEEEMKSLKENEVWKFVDKDEAKGHKILTNKWVFRIKENGTYKARLVARGCEQRNIDFDEIFSPVACQSALKTLFAYAAAKKYCIMTFDVKTAFLYGDLKNDIYMKIPKGYEEVEGKICCLKKSLYGLKQAPQRWNKKFIESINEIGFVNTKNEPCVFKNADVSVILAIYVDDGLIVGRNKAQMKQFLTELNNKFELKIYEDPKSYLGMEIKRDDKGIFLTQTSYVKGILGKYNMDNCKSENTPCPNEQSEVRTTQEEGDIVKFPYREAVGSLLYLSTRTRPDIAHAVGLASRKVEEPSKADVNAVKKIFRYLAGTIQEGLYYKNDAEVEELEIYCDSDYAGDLETRRSTTGYVLMLGGGPVAWCSRRQPVVALSSTEAEFIAAAESCKETIFIKSFLNELNIKVKVTFNVDNQSAIQLIKTGIFNKRSKHIDVRYHYIHELYNNNEIHINYCPSDCQTADILTKSLNKVKFKKHRQTLLKSL